MIRATTPTHQFYFDTDPSLYEKILITYSQHGKIVLEKSKDDLTVEQFTDDNSEIKYVASFQLTQEEANLFCAEHDKTESVQIQIRVKTSGGEVLASDIKKLGVKDVLNDEVL